MAMTKTEQESTAAQAAIVNSIDEATLQALVESMVQKQLAVKEAERAATNPVVAPEVRTAKAQAPLKYLTHWRNDQSPDAIVTLRSMNEDGTPGPAVKGRFITFRRGHFFSTRPEEDAFLKWVMDAPATDPYDNTRVVGGNPSFYISDGNEITKCEVNGCDEPFVAGSAAYKAHLKASHGIVR